MNATLWPEHEGARRRGLPVVKACYPRLVSKLAGVPPIMVLTAPKNHDVGKSYPAVEETSHAVEESSHGFYFFFLPNSSVRSVNPWPAAGGGWMWAHAARRWESGEGVADGWRDKL